MCAHIFIRILKIPSSVFSLSFHGISFNIFSEFWTLLV